MSTTLCSQNAALRDLLDTHLAALAAEEGLTPEAVIAALEAGTMVLLGNPAHAGLKPILVGQPARVKVNANIGTSPLNNCPNTEERKIHAALDAGADTVMDLSIAGDLDALRQGMLAACPRPLGTWLLYTSLIITPSVPGTGKVLLLTPLPSEAAKDMPPWNRLL